MEKAERRFKIGRENRWTERVTYTTYSEENFRQTAIRECGCSPSLSTDEMYRLLRGWGNDVYELAPQEIEAEAKAIADRAARDAELLSAAKRRSEETAQRQRNGCYVLARRESPSSPVEVLARGRPHVVAPRLAVEGLALDFTGDNMTDTNRELKRQTSGRIWIQTCGGFDRLQRETEFK